MIIKKIVRKIFPGLLIDKQDPKSVVGYSAEKYKDTYILLGEYDRKTERATKILAKPGPLRKALQ